MSTPLRDALITSADALASKLESIDAKLDLVLANMAASAAADRAELNGTRPAPKPTKASMNGKGGHQ